MRKIPVNPLVAAMAQPVAKMACQDELDSAKQQADTPPEPQEMQLVKSTARSREIDQIYDEDHGIHFNLSDAKMDRHTESLLEHQDNYTSLEEALKTPMTRDQLTHQVISKAFFEEDATLEDLAGYRIKVGWRLVREMCRMKGLAHPEDSILDALQPTSRNIDPWVVPETWKRPARVNLTTLSQISVKYYHQCENLAEKFHYKRHVLEAEENQPNFVAYPGLAILPPPIPWYWWEQDKYNQRKRVVENYDPHEDLALVFYTKVINQLAEELQIYEGSVDDPDQGRFGMKGLTDVETIREAFPSRFQLEAYEELLVEEALQAMTQFGQTRARKILRDRHGLTRLEIEGLCKIAKAHIRKQMESDIEEDRAFMVTRLEEFIRRARDSLELRAELAGLKQLTIVLGLARSEMGDAMSDFVNVVSDISSSRGPLVKIEEGEFEVLR